MSTQTSSVATPAVRVPFSKANKVGLVLAGLLGVADLTVLANPTPPGQVGPPLGILVLDTVLGVITVVAVGLAWRSRSLSMVSALPAFFAGVPAFLVALVSVFTVVTVATVVLMLMPSRRPLDA